MILQRHAVLLIFAVISFWMDFDMHSNLYNSAVCWYISRYFFSLSTVVCLSPPLIFNEVLKWGRKKREYLSCFYLFICGTLYIDWKSHLLCIIRGHPILLSHNENRFNSPQLLCVKLDREIERDRKNKCATNFFSLFSCGKYNATDGDGYIEFENRNNYRPESVNGLRQH